MKNDEETIRVFYENIESSVVGWSMMQPRMTWRMIYQNGESLNLALILAD